MSSKRKPFSLALNLLLRVLVVAIFVAGILPIPALADATGTIAGHISDNSTGNPAPNSTVYVFTSGSSPPITYINTDQNGDYSVNVSAGYDYEVEARSPGLVSQRVTGQTVTENATTTVNFSLEHGGTINGTVTDNLSSPIQDALVRAFLPASPDSQYNSEPTAANGQYSLTVPPGQGYTLTAESQDFVTANQTGIDVVADQQQTIDFALQLSPVPNFNIVHSEGRFSFMLAAGANITETINVTSVNGFTGTVDLHFGGPPEIENYSFTSPAQVNLAAGQTQQVTLTIGAGSMMPSGTYQCGLDAQSSAYGGLQRGFFFTVIIGVPGQPLLSASPPMVGPGGQTNLFASQFPSSANITLTWDSGPYDSQEIASGQVNQDGTWSYQMTISDNMSTGQFAIKATADQAMAVCQLTITSGAEPDFHISASPQFVSVTPGQSANVTIYVTSINGFNAPVGLTVGSASGINRSLSAANVTPSAGGTASSVLTITAADWISPDMYQLNVDATCAEPAINKVTNINLDVQPSAEWGPSISLSQSYAQEGDTITVSGANFPPSCNGENVTITEAFSGTILQTTPSTISVSNGGFTGTFTIPSGIPSGNYRIRAEVLSTSEFDERDFQILGTGETFNLDVSPWSTEVVTEQGSNSSSVSINIFSMGGSSPSVNLALEGVPPWLTYRFGSLANNTPATGDDAVTVPAGGSASRNLNLTANLTAPTGTYYITVKGWVNGGDEQRADVELTVQPPAGFGMTQLTLSPSYGANGQNVNFTGSGFTECTPSQVTEITFGQLDLITGQSIPTINVPTSGDSAGRFSGTFRVPAVLPPGTYYVKFRVGTMPYDKFMMKSFTITGPGDTFVLQASPAFLWTEQGMAISTMVKVQAVGSTSPTVNLALEGVPPDINTTFGSANITAPPGGTIGTNLELDVTDWLPTGHYTITIRGQKSGGDEVHRFPLELDVAPPAGMGVTSIYLSPNTGSQGTWITISGNGFQPNEPLTHLYFGPPNQENDRIGSIPSVTTDGAGSFTAVIQVPPGLTPGTYPVEVNVGTYPDDRIAVVDFWLVGDDSSFNVNLSPNMIQVAPGTQTGVAVNLQAFGTSSTNVTLRVEGPPNIEWRFDGGNWQASRNVTLPIGSSMTSSLEIQPKPSTSMGHYSLAVKAISGNQTEIRNLELDVGASSGYDMPILSLNPNTGTAGTSVSFSGSNFPPETPVAGITFAGANITLGQAITTSVTGSFSGAFSVPATLGGQPIAPGTYDVRVYVGSKQAEVPFYIYGSDDTFSLSLSPNFLQSGPGTEVRTSGLLRALGGASPTVKMAVRGLPPGVDTTWNGLVQPVFSISAPPGGQNNFDLGLVLPDMIAMGQYPATLEGWVDDNSNGAWDEGEKTVRIDLELAVMAPEGYNMGMLSLTPSYGQVGDTITFSGSGFPADTPVESLTFAQTDILGDNPITTASDGTFSGVFTVPDTAFGMPTGPGNYPVDIWIGGLMGGFDFQVVSGDQKFSVMASPGWLARPAGDSAFVNIQVRSLVTSPPSPTVILLVEGLPMGVTASFTSANVTPSFGGMEGRELRLNISSGTPMGNYPISIRAYNAADPSEEMFAGFTLEVTPSSDFMDMGMAMITLSDDFGSTGDRITVSGYGFPKNQPLDFIRLGPTDVTPSVNTTTDDTGAFSAVITVPSLPSGPQPLDVSVQNVMRNMPFHIMSNNDTFSIDISPNWLEPVPAGDPDGRQIAITIKGLPGKTPLVNLSVEGLYTAFGTISENWTPASQTVNVTSAGGSATATLRLVASEEVSPGPYPFNIVAVDAAQNRRDFYMEFQVGPPAGYNDMNEQGYYFPDIFFSPKSGPVGTQVTYTGTNLPPGANMTRIDFAGNNVPLPTGGVTADSTGSISGSFIVQDAWHLPPGGFYWVNFHMEKDSWWQDIGQDFNLVRENAAFSLEANPNWLPPIPPGSFGQTKVKVKALGYNSVNVTLAIMENMNGWGIPGGASPHWNTTDGPVTVNVTVPSGGQASKDFYLQGASPGHYMITIVGWIDSNANQMLDKDIPTEAESEFCIPLDFDVEPPEGFTSWDMDDMMDQMGMTADDAYLFYFPEYVLNPNMGPADSKVTIKATDFPAGANVTHLRFAGMNLPVPTGTAADSNGDFTLIFNVPKTVWGGAIGPGWYDVEVEAQKSGQPPIFIMKPFQVTSADVAFTLRADPDWLPPIPLSGNATTLIRVRSTGSAANVTLSVDKIPPGITTSFSSNTVNVSSGGTGSATLTLTPTNIPPGHYGAEIMGTATVNGQEKVFYTHVEFDVEPPEGFTSWDMDDMMDQMGMTADDAYFFYFPEYNMNPNIGPAGKKVTVSATDFPAGANVTHLRFAGMDLPVPTGTAADENGEFTLVFNVPKTIWGGTIGPGWYDVEVEAQKPGEPGIFIMKPFQVTSADVAFTLRADPDWLPPIPPEGSSTTIRVTSLGAGANVTLTVDKIPPGITTSFASSQVNVSPGGTGSTTLTLTPTNIPPGHYGAEIMGTATISGNLKTFYTHLEFDVESPEGFTSWDMNDMMDQMGMTSDDAYLFYFPEYVMNPNVGPAGKKVTVSATDFPAGANVTHLRFAGMDLPFPAGTAANENGDFTLVFNVPKTIWGGTIGPGWYDVEVEAQKPGEPPVFIMKPFQVTSADSSFTLRADPDWLPPIPPEGSSTTIRVTSLGAGANVSLTVEKIPPGITTSLSPSQVNVSPGDSGSATLTLTPNGIPPGHYGAEILGTATISGNVKTFYAHIEFDIQPSGEFMDTTWMEQQGVWFPEIVVNPNSGPVKTKVNISATDFPAGANITHVRFAGREMPIPASTAADENGDANLVFNVPSEYSVGQYMIEVEASKPGMQPVFIAKPFFIEDAGVTFNLDVVPGFLPGVAQGESGSTTIFVKSTGQSVTIQLYVDGLPPGVTGNFETALITVPPGGSTSTQLTITTRGSTATGQYPLTIRGVSGGETRMVPFGFGVMPPAIFQVPEFTISPDYAPAGYTDKQYKITFSGNGFQPNQAVASITFGSQPVAIPADLTTDANGNFNGVFQMPTGLDPGTYDVRVAVADTEMGYIYDSRPFSIRGATAKFILKLSPPYLPPVVQGGQGTTQVNVQSVGSGTANVTLYVDGLAPGISAAFTPSNMLTVPPGGVSSATLNITVANSVPPGPYPLSIRGVSGSETIIVPLGFGVMPDIGGGEGHATLTINPAQARPGEHIGVSGAGFTANATITLSAAPPGAATPMNITPGTITVQDDGTWATEITVPPADQVPPGTYIIKASDGTMAAKTPFSIVPATGADFFLTVSPQFIEVVRGQSGNTTMTLSSKNGFKDPVVFSVGHLVPGVTATFRDTSDNIISQFAGMPGGIREIVAPIPQTPVPGEDMVITVQIDVDAETGIGPYDVALEAGSSTVFRAVPLGFMVTSAGANMAISPQGGPADTDIRVSGSGFTAGETITITFAGTSIATVPASVTTAQDGSFTAVITAPSMNPGIYSVRVVGGTSGISIDQPFSLKPTAVNSFVIYANPMKVDVPRGGSGTVKIKLEPLGTFQSAVTLSISGLTAINGATSSLSPSATVTPNIGTTSTAKLTINVPAGATAGRYPLVITGASGAISKTRTITLNVVPPIGTPDFAISLAPNTIPISANSSGNTTVSIKAINGFSGTVALTVAMATANATWPPSITCTAGNVTPSSTTGLGKQAVVFTADNTTQPGTWTFRITGTSGALTHYADVMVISTPSGTTVTPFSTPRLDPTTVTSSTPIDMTAPWGDKITINGIINEGSEASVITPSKVDVAPDTLANLPEGATDMLGRVTNVESDNPVDGVEWDIGFPYDLAELEAAGLTEENLKIAYLDPDTGEWTEVTTTIDTDNQIAYATPDHFSSWTLIGTPSPPPSRVVSGSGGGGGGGPSGITVMTEYTDDNGRFVIDATAQSDDGKVTLEIPKNTVGLNRLGQPIYTVSIKQNQTPPALSANNEFVGLVYDIGPNGTTFDPPVNLTFSYADFQVPAAAHEADLVIVTWQDGTWVELEGVNVDVEANTITVPVSHFSLYAIIAHTGIAKFEITALKVLPFEVETGETVTVTATIANTGDISGSYQVTFAIDGEIVATEEIEVAGHTSQEVEFTTTPEKAGTYDLDVNGTVAQVIVRQPTLPPEEETTTEAIPAPVETSPTTTETTPTEQVPTSAPVTTTPEAAVPTTTLSPEMPETEATTDSQLNDLLILLGTILGGAAIIGIVYWRTRTRHTSQ